MRQTILKIACTLLLVFSGEQLYALGLGVNRTMSPDPMIPAEPSWPSFSERIMGHLKGLDIVYDTAVAKDRLFNYRATFECYTITERPSNLFTNYSREANHIMFANTFGFGFLRTRYFRLWAGPQFTLSYKFTEKDSRILDRIIYNKIGAVVGANIHASDIITLGFEWGIRTGFGFDLMKSISHTFTRAGLEPIATFKLIFRLWDSYPAAI
ncbi:MAG: hypothetical protein JW807_01760 [Spirochaetes bacterium]|nr:hypothetical protein [Spirochaetota bacterium]